MQRKFIFDGGSSTRYHTLPVHNRQTIADHSFGVAWLCELITNGEASKNLIMAALAHDLAEHIVGDIPSPAKRALKIGAMYDVIEQEHLKGAGIVYANNLTKEEALTLRFSDMLEGAMFSIQERKLGNLNVAVVFLNFSAYILQLLSDTTSMCDGTYPYASRVREIAGEVMQEWSELQ